MMQEIKICGHQSHTCKRGNGHLCLTTVCQTQRQKLMQTDIGHDATNTGNSEINSIGRQLHIEQLKNMKQGSMLEDG